MNAEPKIVKFEKYYILGSSIFACLSLILFVSSFITILCDSMIFLDKLVENISTLNNMSSSSPTTRPSSTAISSTKPTSTKTPSTRPTSTVTKTDRPINMEPAAASVSSSVIIPSFDEEFDNPQSNLSGLILEHENIGEEECEVKDYMFTKPFAKIGQQFNLQPREGFWARYRVDRLNPRLILGVEYRMYKDNVPQKDVIFIPMDKIHGFRNLMQFLNKNHTETEIGHWLDIGITARINNIGQTTYAKYTFGGPDGVIHLTKDEVESINYSLTNSVQFFEHYIQQGRFPLEGEHMIANPAWLQCLEHGGYSCHPTYTEQEIPVNEPLYSDV